MPALRNKSDDVLKALAQSGGMLGFSIYPHHLKDKSACTLESFCEMVARTADLIGIDHIGIGSDFNLNHLHDLFGGLCLATNVVIEEDRSNAGS